MNKKFLGIGIIIAIMALGTGAYLTTTDSNIQIQKTGNTEYDYDVLNNVLRYELDIDGIAMSSQVILRTDTTIEKYCSFFSDEKIQQQVKHCTSTELRTSDGEFLGNIHIVGTKQSPFTVITLIQSDPFVSQINEVKTTFGSVIENTVCDCWEQGPKEFPTIDSWIDGIYKFHSSGEKPTSKSQIITLDDKKLQAELTTNSEGYLWKLFIDL